MSERRLWAAVLVVSCLGIASIGRNVLADSGANRVGRRIDLAPEVLRGDRVPIHGSPDAPYTLVEFMDYECGPCRRFDAQLRPILERGRVALIVRHSPGRSHPFADRAARYALGVENGSAADIAHKALFHLRWSEDDWSEFLRINGRKIVRPRAEIDARLREDQDAARTAKISGTPQLFLIHNDRVYEVLSPDALAKL